MGSSNVTLRSLVLGAQDSTTGWYAADRTAESTIPMPMIAQGTYNREVGIGYYGKYDYLGITTSPCAEGDEIKNAQTKYFEIKMVQDVPYLDSLAYYKCELSYIPMHYDRPATSGTWHLDSGALKTDIRYRQKTWLEQWLVPASITKDDGATAAPYIICFSNADYPIVKVFVNKGQYLIFSIDTGESTSLIDHSLGAYAYHESVPIELFSINKADCTATNLIEKAYQELRRVAETQPTGSIRKVGRMTTTPTNLGSTILFGQKAIIEHVRAKA